MASKARAYAAQARADYDADAYVASGETAEPAVAEHHRLQLLQMSLEKLAKAFLYHAEPEDRYSHHVVLSALNRLRAHAIAEAAGMKFTPFIRMLNAAKPIYLQIEAASPSVGLVGRSLTREESERTENVEYPWQSDINDPTSWIARAAHAFRVVRALRYDPPSVRAVRLLDRLILATEVVLPTP